MYTTTKLKKGSGGQERRYEGVVRKRGNGTEIRDERSPKPVLFIKLQILCEGVCSRMYIVKI